MDIQLTAVAQKKLSMQIINNMYIIRDLDSSYAKQYSNIQHTGLRIYLYQLI